MARATRRDLLGAASFTALAGIAAVSIAKPDAQAEAVEVTSAAPDPDGPLIALCDRFLALQAAVDLTYDVELREFALAKEEGRSSERLIALEKEGDTKRDPWFTEQSELLDEIGEMRATTLAGQRARARVLMAWYSLHRRGPDEPGDAIEWHSLAPLFRDLLGEAV